MHARARKVAEIAVGALAALALLLALGQRAAAPPAPMKPDQFARLVRQLASDAHEAAQLSQALRAGILTRHAALTHHDKLRDDVADTLEQLDAPPPQGAEGAHAGVRALGERVKAGLSALPARMADPAGLAKLAADQAQAGDELKRLAGAP
jgi:hypothetical protein